VVGCRRQLRITSYELRVGSPGDEKIHLIAAPFRNLIAARIQDLMAAPIEDLIATRIKNLIASQISSHSHWN